MLLTQDYIRALNLHPTLEGLHRQQRIIMGHFIPPILLILLLRHPIRHHKTPLVRRRSSGLFRSLPFRNMFLYGTRYNLRLRIVRLVDRNRRGVGPIYIPPRKTLSSFIGCNPICTSTIRLLEKLSTTRKPPLATSKKGPPNRGMIPRKHYSC